MKKVLLTVLVAGLMATAANAATLRMNWAGGGQIAELAVSDYADIEVWVDLLAGDTLSTLIYGNFTVPAGAVTQTGTVAYPGWNDGSVGGVFGSPAQQISFFAPGDPQVIAGPGSFMLGTQTIHLDIGVESDWIELYFAPPGAQFIMKDGAGNDFKWNANWAPSFAGYVMFGDWGNPGWGTSKMKGHQPTANPLLIHVIPEPGTLALLALGGLGILRRR